VSFSTTAYDISLRISDAVIHTRITNDEKALRRVIKKFHTFSTASGGAPASDDARDAFLLELASFELSLKKGLMICEAEARQVEEYDRERQRIGEFETLSLDWCAELTRIGDW
jgi:THO complex subunit 7